MEQFVSETEKQKHTEKAATKPQGQPEKPSQNDPEDKLKEKCLGYSLGKRFGTGSKETVSCCLIPIMFKKIRLGTFPLYKQDCLKNIPDSINSISF